MKYFKIILSFILSAALLINPGVIFAESTAFQNDDTDYVKTAVRLGLMPEKLAETPLNEVSRGDAIAAVINLYSEASMSADDVQFSDIDKKSEYYETVCRAKSLGLLSGFPDNTVRIEEKMSVGHAVKMILYALGYKQITDAGMSVINAVNRAGFCSTGDAFSEETLTVSKLARLLVKGGEAHPVIVTRLSNEGGELLFDYNVSDKTLFEDNLNISFARGIVTYCGGADLSLENFHDEDKAVIDGVIYRYKSEENYIGCNVKAYYRVNDGSDLNDIIYMYPENNDILEIDADDISDFSGDTLYYYANGKRRSKNLKIGSADFIYNGSICTNPTKNNLMPDDGFLRIIDNNGDGEAEVIVCDDYETVVVDAVSKNDGIIYGLYGNNVQIDLNKYENVQFVSETNEKYDIFELSKWDVLSVAKSEDYENIKLVCAVGLAEGTVELCNFSEKTLVIGGKEYKVTSDFAKYEFSNISVGTAGTFYLNTSGKIAAYSENKTKNYGFMIKSTAIKKHNLNEDVVARILTASGEVKIFNYAERVLYNGASVPRNSLDGMPENTLCIYELNPDNKIKSIDTAGGSYGFGASVSGTSLRKLYDGYSADSAGLPSQNEKLTYKAATSILGGQVCLASNAVIFEIPLPLSGGMPEEKYYKAFKRDDYVENDKDICVQAYNSNFDAIAADAAVVYVQRGKYNASEVYDDTHVWVIGNISTVNDDEGVQRKMFDLTDGKGRITLFADNDALASASLKGKPYILKEGDIIRCDYDEENNITNCTVLYSAEENKMGTDSNPNTDGFAASFRVELCYAYKISESLMITTTSDLRTEEPADEDSLLNKQLRNLSGYGIVYYDSERKKVMPGNGDLLKCYTRNGHECSKMFIFDRYGDAKTLVIYD